MHTWGFMKLPFCILIILPHCFVQLFFLCWTATSARDSEIYSSWFQQADSNHLFSFKLPIFTWIPSHPRVTENLKHEFVHAWISLNTFMCRQHSIHISYSSNMEIVISDETTVAKLNFKSKMKLMSLGPLIQGFILKSHNLVLFFYGVYSNILYNFPFPLYKLALIVDFLHWSHVLLLFLLYMLTVGLVDSWN